MKLDPVEQKLGYRWFFGAGAFALFLIYFLVSADTMLSTSDAEVKARDTIREVRLAQTTLGSFVTDSRQTQDGVIANRPAPEAPQTADADPHH